MKPEGYELFTFDEQEFLLRHLRASIDKAASAKQKLTDDRMLKIAHQINALYTFTCLRRGWQAKNLQQVKMFLYTANESYIESIITAHKNQLKIQ